MASNNLEADETYIDLTSRYSNLPEILSKALNEEKSDHLKNKIQEIIDYSQNEIDVICRTDTTNILNCLNSLDRLKTLYSSVKDSCNILNNQFDQVFYEFNNSFKNIEKYRIIQRNISMTLNILLKCLPIFELDFLISQPITQNNYYDILSACEELKHKSVLSLQQISIIKKIYDRIPDIKKAVKLDSVENLKTFLNKTLEGFKFIGMKIWVQMLKSVHVDFGDSPSLRDVKDIPPFSNVDFSPIYWYSYIVEKYDVKVREIRFYMDQRTEQLTLIFNPAQKFDASMELSEQIQSALYNVIGYFAVEHFIMHSVKNFITQEYINKSYNTISSSIFICLSNSIKTLEDFTKINEVKAILGKVDIILQSLGVASNLASKSNEVFSAVFFKLVGKSFQIEDISTPSDKSYKSFTFKNQQEEFKTLGIFSSTSSSYPKSIIIPNLINDIIQKFLKMSEKSMESVSKQDHSAKAEANSFEMIICFANISLKLIQDYMESAKTIDGTIISYYNIEFLKNHMKDISSNYNQKKEHQIQINDFFKSLESLSLKIQITFEEIIHSDISETFVHLQVDYNPSYESTDILPNVSHMISTIQDIYKKISIFQSKLLDNYLVFCSSEISNNFCMYLTSNMFTSCNRNFLNTILAQVNFTKMLLLELSGKNTSNKIEDNYEEIKQMLSLILINDWSSYFDNFGLSFSSYNRTNPDNILKLIKKIHASETSTIKTTFSSFFSKEKTVKTPLGDIISTLQKLSLKKTGT